MNVRLLRRRREPTPGPETGWPYVVQVILAVGIAYISARMAAKKRGSPINDDKPTTLTTRGSYVPWYLGIRKIGPVVAFAGGRYKKKEKPEGAKGFGGGQKVDVFYEFGWHLIGVGPCDALHEITMAGELLFEGPITPDSHPSGSTIDLGTEGAFAIYWGEQGQPINTNLDDFVGISSRWPRCCYVYWKPKRLGPSPAWPLLNYVMARRPSGIYLADSQSWYEPTAVLTGATALIDDFVANADPDVGYLEIDGDHTGSLDPGRSVLVSGNGLTTGDYIVRRTISVQVQIDTVTDTRGNTHAVFETRTRLFLETGTAGANDAGQVEFYAFAKDDGANIAHAVADLLFAEWPAGLGLDPDGLEPWDVESLEEWGVEAETLNLRSSLYAPDGTDVASILGTAMQDHGVMLIIDTLHQGKLKFVRVREPSGTLPHISADHYTDGPPERETLLGELNTNKITFTFSDREKDFADNTIMLSEDGAVAESEYFRAQNVPISSTTHFPTASSIAQRRSQEELAGGNKFGIKATREARALLPGTAITADGIDDTLRILSVSVDPLSEEVTIDVTADAYGVQRTDYVDLQGGGNVTVNPPLPDIFQSIEIPEALLSTEEMLMSVIRIRAHAQTYTAQIHASADDSTYTLLGEEPGSAAGGYLDVAMPASAAYYQALGPTFDSIGPDADAVLDLTGDDLSWSRGRQLAVFQGPNNDVEICFLRKITSLGGGQYRLDGLLRARYDTRRLNVASGAQVYVFANDDFLQFSDLLLQPNQDLYVKSQPYATGGAVALAAVSPIGRNQYGKGLVPVPPEALHVTAPAKGSPSYVASADVTLRWGWSTSSSKNTGAGYQAAGAAIGAAVIKGSFLVELRTAAGAIVSTQTTSSPTVTYTAAELAASPINGGNFRVRVYHLNNGYSSIHTELLVTKVT